MKKKDVVELFLVVVVFVVFVVLGSLAGYYAVEAQDYNKGVYYYSDQEYLISENVPSRSMRVTVFLFTDTVVVVGHQNMDDKIPYFRRFDVVSKMQYKKYKEYSVSQIHERIIESVIIMIRIYEDKIDILINKGEGEIEGPVARYLNIIEIDAEDK